MLNNNFVLALKSLFNNSGINFFVTPDGTRVTHTMNTEFRNIFGNPAYWVDYIGDNSENAAAPTLGTSKGGFYLLFGDSNTAPTSKDYKLGNVITNYTAISQSHYYTSNIALEEAYSPTIMTLTKVIKNETSEPITIKEIGAYYIFQAEKPIMIAREVIDPVTIQPGEKHSFTMDISVV